MTRIPPSWMIEELERLRREQNPERQRQQLELPVPMPQERPEEPQKREERGVVVIQVA